MNRIICFVLACMSCFFCYAEEAEVTEGQQNHLFETLNLWINEAKTTSTELETSSLKKVESSVHSLLQELLEDEATLKDSVPGES